MADGVSRGALVKRGIAQCLDISIDDLDVGEGRAREDAGASETHGALGLKWDDDRQVSKSSHNAMTCCHCAFERESLFHRSRECLRPELVRAPISSARSLPTSLVATV